MATVTSTVILEIKKIKSLTLSIVCPSICHELMGLDTMILFFWMLSIMPAFSLSSFTRINRLFNSYSLSAIGGGGLVTKLCQLLRSKALEPTRHLCPWDFLGNNTGVVCHSLLQRIFLIQGSNLVSCTTSRFFTKWATKKVLRWCDLHIWGYWYFSQQYWFQLMFHLAQDFALCTLHRS